jgi:hypothetical protein
MSKALLYIYGLEGVETKPVPYVPDQVGDVQKLGSFRLLLIDRPIGVPMTFPSRAHIDSRAHRIVGHLYNYRRVVQYPSKSCM